ncbi:hypothetical protein KHP62_11865 [Rhodobacteraceae bacterium NNCM2]|nr:hypothetical protein [Coraliihabitans acroporae]
MNERDLRKFDLLAMRGFALLVALGILARLIVLPVIAEAHSGSVPICGGGKIVWLSADGDVDDPGNVSDPCPYFGLSIAPEVPVAGLEPPQMRWHTVRAVADAAQSPDAAAPRSVRTRAPPAAI